MPRKQDGWARDDAPRPPGAFPPGGPRPLRDPDYVIVARATPHERDAVLEAAGDLVRVAEAELDREAERIYGHMPASDADWCAARELAAIRLRGGGIR